MIRIQYLTGPQNGLTRAYTTTAMTFGRSPDNPIAIDETHLSRVHGEIRVENGQYVLINHSPNGTKINGKKVKKPTPLAEGDVISVGKIQLFAVGISGIPQTTNTVDSSAETADINNEQTLIKPKLSSKAKLWIGIISFNAFVILVFLFASKNVKKKDANIEPKPFSTAAIKLEITTPLKKPLNQREAAHNLQQAQELFPRTTSTPDGQYRCYNYYKLALAFGNKKRFTSTTQANFFLIEDKLVKRVQNNYFTAYTLLKNKQWNDARKAFENLRQTYPAHGTKLTDNIQNMITFARKSVKKPKGKVF